MLQHEEEVGEQEMLNLIEEKLQTLDRKNMDEVRTTLELTWPEEAFKHTQLKEGNPLEVSRNSGQALILLQGEMSMEKGMHRQYANRYPELLEMENSDNLYDAYRHETSRLRNGEWESREY